MLEASRIKVFTITVKKTQELNFQAEESYINKIWDVLIITAVSLFAATLESGVAIWTKLP